MPRPFGFCLCADDYAMTLGVSRGILTCLEAGALSATSVMTTSPWWPQDAPALAPFKGRASIGLHLNLTLGAPLGPMPDFAPQDALPGIGTIIRRSRNLPLREVAAEIDRQLDRFAEVFDGPPDHVDGHQHVHVLAPIRTLLFEALARRGWQPWLRDSSDSWSHILRRGGPVRKAAAVALLARGFGAQAQRFGFSTNEGFAGFSSFDISKSYGQSFATYIKAPGRRHLVMVHPGDVDEALRGLDPVVETREAERDYLSSPAFTRLLEAQNATLICKWDQ